MSDSPNQSMRSLLRTIAPAGIIGICLALILYAMTGGTLGLFFGGLVLLTILLPPLTLTEVGFVRQGLIASTVNDSIGLVWLIAIFTSQVTLMQWLKCYLLLAAYSFALWGLVRALAAIRVHALLASALSITIGVLWLSWPIWMARLLVRGDNAAIVSWLADPHPPLAINGVLKNLGIWSERPIAYNHLLNLGQDVAYQLPESIVSGFFVHVIVGGLLFAIGSIVAERYPLSPEGRGMG